jgi:glycerol-3-phosphate acyltransferase PlsY
MILHIFLCILAYLLGSIPFGLVLTRAAGLGDIRDIGSGNIGATNVLRTGNKKLALATLILDALKGAIIVLLVRALDHGGVALAALAAFLGHLYPVWLGFKGGKGVATGLGILLAVCWPAGLLSCVVWAGTAALFRYSSLAALAAFTLAPFAAFALQSWKAGVLAFVMAVLVFWKHRANIERLLAGAEPKIGKKV